MAEKILEIIPVTPDLSVILFETSDPKGGPRISIKQNEEINNKPGETMLNPDEIPALIKALNQAALKLTHSNDSTNSFIH